MKPQDTKRSATGCRKCVSDITVMYKGKSKLCIFFAGLLVSWFVGISFGRAASGVCLPVDVLYVKMGESKLSWFS